MEPVQPVCLCIDLGNTLGKLGVFHQGRLLHQWSGKALESCVEAVLDQFHPSRSILSSVIAHDPALESLLASRTEFILLDHQTRVPFSNAYEGGSTLGPDRIALAAAAVSHYPGHHCLVVAAGTCIVLNLVSREGVFLGGSIAPGLQMRMRALHDFTEKLPLEVPAPLFPLVGYNTRQSILSGCLGGAVAETEGLIGKYRSRYEGLKVLLTGGDSPFFNRLLETETSLVPDLLLRGLLAILEFNPSSPPT